MMLASMATEQMGDSPDFRQVRLGSDKNSLSMQASGKKFHIGLGGRQQHFNDTAKDSIDVEEIIVDPP